MNFHTPSLAVLLVIWHCEDKAVSVADDIIIATRGAALVAERSAHAARVTILRMQRERDTTAAHCSRIADVDEARL